MRLRFDRGTLVLCDFSERVASALPFVCWDPRSDCWRAPAYRYPELVAALQARAVPFEGLVFPGGPTIERPELRPYQETALATWMTSGARGIVSLPTGSGKTRLAVTAIAATRAPTLCLVPTRILLEQWCDVLAKSCVEVGCLGDGRRTLASVTVATFESAYRRMSEIGARFRLLIVDEVHHFGRGDRDEALEMSAATMRLGLTATPPSDPVALAKLQELVGPVRYELSIDDLAGDYLAPYETHRISLELTVDERRAYSCDVERFHATFRMFLRSRPGGTWAEFTSVALRTSEGREALAALRRSSRLLTLTDAKIETVKHLLRRHKDVRILLFTGSNDAAYALAKECLVMPMTCDIGRSERADVVERFRAGSLRALVSSRVLNEGFDLPDAEVAIVLGGSQGRREHVQRIGRVLRPSPGKRAIVYELVMRGTSEVRQARERGRGLAA